MTKKGPLGAGGFPQAHPEWRKEFDWFRIAWAPQKGRTDFVRFTAFENSRHIGTVSVGHAGSPENAWKVALKLAEGLAAGDFAEGDIPAQRDALCQA